MATAAVFIALGGGAYALSGIPDRGGTFHGCVSRKTGLLRVVKSAKSCRKARRHGRHKDLGEFAVSWGQQGPRGVPGTNGTDASVNGVAARGDLTGTYPAPTIAPPEPWHVVGDPGQPAFQHSCSNNGTTTEFYKDREGVVHLQGRYHGCSSAGEVAFQLPPGYRPAADATLQFPLASSGTGAVVAVDGSNTSATQTGSVACGGTDCYLNGITFRAES
jgi:hypothetical protein